MPANNKLQHIFGNVKSSKPLLPKVSIVQIAGKAKTKLTRPKPKDARRAVTLSAPALTKIVDE